MNAIITYYFYYKYNAIIIMKLFHFGFEIGHKIMEI